MRKLFAAVLFFIFASAAHAQGSAYTAGPFNTGGSVYVCTLPVTVTPCTSLASIFSAANLTGALPNPLPVAQGQAVTFYLAAGQYAVQMPAAGFSQIITLGSSSSPSTINALGAFNIKNYGAIGDAKKSTNFTTTNTSATITNATDAPFLASDVGKFIQCNNGSGVSSLTGTNVKINTVNSASNITISSTANGNSGAGQSCIWFTQKETAAFAAAYAAAHTASTGDPNVTTPTLGYPSNIFCPPGGYVLDGPAVNEQETISNSLGVSFSGQPGRTCVLYVSNDFNTSSSGNFCGNTVGLFYYCQVHSLELDNFKIDGVNGNSGTFTSGTGLVKLQNTPDAHVAGVEIDNWGSTGGAGVGCFYIQGAIAKMEYSVCEGAPNGDASAALILTGASSATFESNLFGNHGISKVISGSGARNTTGGSVTFLNDFDDECNNVPCTQITNSTVGFYSGIVLSQLSVDATSSVYQSNMNIGVFGSTVSQQAAITIASGGFLSSQGSTIRGNGTTTAAITGPAGATFVDEGSNTIQNCQSGVCTNVSTANYGTFAFSGGIIPKSSLTHTPNTCYAVTGNLLATAQNICTLLLDQNYQLLNVTAGQGGTTPPTTSCTGAPVVTLSDGTNSSTLTMTTGNTSWSSTGLSTVFKAGNTLTISIGANTCATPPQDVFVNAVLQSVLNN